MSASHSTFDKLVAKISARDAGAGVIGLGYVGLPLAIAVAHSGFPVCGFDIDPAKVASLNDGRSYIEAVPSDALGTELATGRFRATSDFSELGACDVVIICVPTPLTRHREPDLSFVRNTARVVAANLRPGQLVVLEFDNLSGHHGRCREAHP